jgi:6-phosphogluconate dehydrogenase (decarboxylating)
MTNTKEAKAEIRKTLKAAGEMVSQSSTTSVRGFHNHSQGWNIWEFGSKIFLTYIRNGLEKTTSGDLASGIEILRSAGIEAQLYNLDRIVIEVK